MARIAGVDLPREKKLEIGLTYIFGIGRATAQRILKETGVNADQRVRDLNDADTNRLRQAAKSFKPPPQPQLFKLHIPAYAGTVTVLDLDMDLWTSGRIGALTL